MTNTLVSTPKETAETIMKHFAEKVKCKECGIKYLIIPSGVEPFMSKEVKKHLSRKSEWAFESSDLQSILFCEDCNHVRKN